MTQSRFAVVGAGLAGLACARRIADAGHAVTVYDKGRSPGGRMATRRGELAAWDHGAQYFTVRDPVFARLVALAGAAGQAEKWRPRWPGGEQERGDLWVGVPGISALPRWLAGGLQIVPGTRILSMARAASGWILADDRGGESESFDFVVVAVPAAQAAALVAGHTALAGGAASIVMAPCWAVMVAFERRLETGLDADWSPDAVLPWIARNSSKPRRHGLDAWVLHADAGWSRDHFETDAARVQAAMLERLAGRLSVELPPVAAIEAHRWRYARVEKPVGEPYLLDRPGGLALCGDWCLDARVEAAFISGDRLGAELAGG